ncbi:uncharacterized protein LOC135496543 [Lineus longissimus]|uniref:uncharacterized protein LOC135496543 n=1 Tax=Lineus longissimus TaxID=88925 RepID=UPI00315CF39E
MTIKEKERKQRNMSRLSTSSHSTSASNIANEEAEQVNAGVWWGLNEPFSELGKWRQQFKMLMVTGVPILALLAISIYSLQEGTQERLDLVEARETVHFTVQVGWLIHLLQRERDMSVVYLSNNMGANTQTLLSELWSSTDKELEDLPDWPVNVDKEKGRAEFENKKAFKKHLDEHRSNLRINTASLNGEIVFYTSPMRIFMNWLTDSLKKSEHGTLWKTLVAYQKIILCKIEAGVERALGELYFSNHGFLNRAEFVWYIKEHNAYKAYFQLAQQYSTLVTPVLQSRTNTTTGQNVIDSISSMRELIFYQRISEANTGKKWWFSNMTAYQEVLLTIQTDLASLIFNQINEYTSETDTNVAISCVMMGLAICMFPLLLRSVRQTTGDMQRYAIILADKTKDLNREKRRTDQLLYQMLPRPVADQLKNDESVNAEYYKEVSIMFSGIVGFNSISAELAPIDIVSLLGSLYTTLDEVLERHDVYKVETIGDTYMVASGLPTRIGDTHVSEIANLSLDILSVASRHIAGCPTGTIRLRIGIDVGPVMAGVVGLKMPRYCLFGNTVNVASRMETNGLPNRIHISSRLNELLQVVGGYDIQPRQPQVNIKGKGLMSTFWLCGSPTHSTNGNEGSLPRMNNVGEVRMGIETSNNKIYRPGTIVNLGQPKQGLLGGQPTNYSINRTGTSSPPILQLTEGYDY